MSNSNISSLSGESFLASLAWLSRPQTEIDRARKQITSPPEKLFRYRSVNNGNLKYKCEEIEGNIFLAGNLGPGPEGLNDPMDLCFHTEVWSFEDYIRLIFEQPPEVVSAYTELPLEDVEIIRSSDNPSVELRRILQEKHHAHAAHYDEMVAEYSSFLEKQEEIPVLRDAGVACFTETNTNMPMWWYYSNQCSGICLEYTLSEVAAQPLPVVYTHSLPDILRVLIPSVYQGNYEFTKKGGAALPFAMFKEADWSYEKEWRLLVMLLDFDSLSEKLPQSIRTCIHNRNML
jgi:hypothetical protein